MPITDFTSAPNSAFLIPGFPSDKERNLFGIQAEYGRPHSRPGSVCVSVIGTLYEPNSYAAIADMFYYTHQQNISCWFQEMKDTRSAKPYIHIGAMMDAACVQAQDRGFEYVCLVQSDILPKPDLLIRLLTTELPIVAPIIIDPETGKGVGGPQYEPGNGIKPMRWVPLPFLLIRTTVFNCFNQNMFTAQPTEDTLWPRFWHYGHRPYQDTDQILEVATQATRFGNLAYDEQEAWLRSKDEQRRKTPDRGKEGSPYVNNGVYQPWLAGQNGHDPNQ